METHLFTSYRRQAEVDYEVITTRPIDIPMLLQSIHHPAAGGIVLFSGEVKNFHQGKNVIFLEYEAYESMAGNIIKEIIDSAIVKWNLINAAAVHRVGRLNISESAVAAITAHAHRKEAYEANQFIIDKIKNEAPIWKCEYYDDGTYEWGKNC